MKQVRSLLSVFFFIFCPISSLMPMASAGPGGSGGGDAELSTPSEVEKSISEIKAKVIEVLKVERSWYDGFADDSAMYSLKKKFFDTKRDGESLALWAIDKASIKPNKNGPCVDLKGNKKDGAVLKKLAPGSSICLSVPRLTRIPSDQLDRQITALVIHELTHEILESLDEKVPDQVQKQIVSVYAWATTTDFTCSVLAIKDNQTQEIKTYKVSSSDVNVYRVFDWSYPADQLNQAIENARRRHEDNIGRSVGCTTFKFRDF